MRANLDETEVVSIVEGDYNEEYELTWKMSEEEGIEPRTLAEARSLPEWGEWERAIQEELAMLRAAGTWVLEEPPAGANIVGSKWVFKIKKDSAGNVIRRKARLVAQGFSQVPGVDYFDTFAPVAKLASIRTVLAIAAQSDMEMEQIDIKGAYLNGELEDGEVIYMQHPPGYQPMGAEGKVLRLRKTLYGLKQSGRRWYQKLTWIFVDQLGFKRCDVDQAIYFRQLPPDLIVIVVHVDDCTLVATRHALITKLKSDISQYVEISDLGPLHWLLGIQVKRNRELRTLGLSQASYIRAILHRFNFDELKSVSSPMDPNLRLDSSQSPQTAVERAVMRHAPYREALGCLMYAAMGTRPDIAFSVTLLSRFSQNPGPVHWNAVRRVFRYLKGTTDLWLTYGTGTEMNKREIRAYTDADGNQQEDRKAISGNAFLIDGGAVSWYSKQQELISLSTTESEYVAATHAAKEAIWLRQLIGQIFEPIVDPIPLFCDNQSAIALAKDHQYHARTKHIDIRYHFIRWVCEQGHIQLIYCPTGDMLADVLTKPLPSFKTKHFAAELGLQPL